MSRVQGDDVHHVAESQSLASEGEGGATDLDWELMATTLDRSNRRVAEAEHVSSHVGARDREERMR